MEPSRPRPVLPIARSSTDVVLTALGQPAWPVREPQDEMLLLRAAARFGGALEAVEAEPGKRQPGVETVVALGDRFRAAAELYAHLTNRASGVAERTAALDEFERPRVLLCSWDQLSFALLEDVWERTGAGRPIGIVVADDERGMRRQVRNAVSDHNADALGTEP